jgi:RNA polymerase sigma-70 factor, ECF subfamily
MEFFTFDDDYVRRLREGDRVTEEHYEQYFKLFLTMKLLRRHVPVDEIGDIIQDVHLRVYAGLRGENGIRDGSRFGAYVNSICNFIVLERNRRPDRHEEIDEVDAGVDLLRELETKETKERVQRTLRSLGKRDEQILRDLFIDELDKDEICGKHGVDRNYLRVLVHRALEKFREKYADA